jgi:3-hydroxyacyl-CoA dehydrogenase
MDLAGQDIGWSIRKRRAIEHPDRPYSGFPDRVCELGRFGQKTGKGIYLYPDGRTAQIDPEIDALLLAYSAEHGITRRTVSDAEIVDRCLLAMINEGARIVEEGIAYRPVDIDIIYLNGYGFPAERGGPMFHADRIGIREVVARIDALAKGREGWAWNAAPLLRDLATKDEALGSLNRAQRA